jgi:hypothetical protein
MRAAMSATIFVLGSTLLIATQAADPFLGKWNITGTGPDTDYVYWLEVSADGNELSGTFLNRSGSPGSLAMIRVEGGELVFQRGRGGQVTGPVFRARLENGRLVGSHTMAQRGRGGAEPTERTISWIGVRPPEWPDVNASGTHEYGEPVALFDGGSMDAWGVQHEGRPVGWAVVDGLLTNETPGNNIVSHAAFRDFRVEAEYRLAEDSNSGIYLRGRYELQLLDDYGDDPVRTGHLAIYGRTAPSVNAGRPAGEWQTMEAIIVANRLTVTLNGRRVHDNAVIEGITGGALDAAETVPGPLMVQGDHGRVWIRKMVVTPIRTAGQ